MADRETWRPHFATHVLGTYDRRVWNEEEGKHDAQVVDMVCDACKVTHRVVCEQGRPREHVLNFARAHYHADALSSGKR